MTNQTPECAFYPLSPSPKGQTYDDLRCVLVFHVLADMRITYIYACAYRCANARFPYTYP